ncbi:hypothetical protein B0A48_16308 [Cryoendolithus antarcticus]|uniref:NACHT domain-containing protein n=1 Tax=Cryoendolithus antarcticus TaxID=1507870 RepID=A0A1V8SFY5_9PEZI|nr:hypothetical protein B0A48_16308 [Cryoendolithus antarcticus]
MRLLDVASLTFAEFREEERPAYVIASHRWSKDSRDEATFQDVKDCRNTSGRGYQKVEAFADYVKSSISHIKWLWIDTCCINKESAAELSEAINSMFDWYHNAEVCLAYLADVETAEDVSGFEKSAWFKRGWTLQELLAPQIVVFVTADWQVIGHKGSSSGSNTGLSIGRKLQDTIARVTGVPVDVLLNYDASADLSVEEKLKWMDGRTTTRPEDMSYALFGILGVTLAVIYGEKYTGARQRLMAAIHQRNITAAQKAEEYRKIAAWLSSSDPWTNHDKARQQHEPDTGAWLLEHSQYLAWKSGPSRLLWVYGKAGCGKTILCSTAIEDIKTHCRSDIFTGQAIFYFSFSDTQKQTHRDLLVSLVVQLGQGEPGLSMLRQAYQRTERRLPGSDELQKILWSSIAAYNSVYVHLDALDECPEGDGVRQIVLSSVEQLLDQLPNVRILVTSRDVPDVRSLMQDASADLMPITARTIDADIHRYILTYVSRDSRLSRLDPAARALIEDTLSERADGMFRWVYCQLEQLKMFKSTRLSSLRAALHALPKTLDGTYERMLDNINEADRSYAFTLLRWLAYAQSPLSLLELAEASIIDTTDTLGVDGSVDTDDRGDWADTLNILAGFVTIDGVQEEENDHVIDSDGDFNVKRASRQIEEGTRVRLAHFSVKEYLESSRILESNVKYFQLDPFKEHRYLTHSCLVYLTHYSASSLKTSTEEDLEAFPLLVYAAKTWPHYAFLQQCSSSTREVAFLDSVARKRDWLQIYDPDRSWKQPFENSKLEVATALYYASLLGLKAIVQELLNGRADVNAQGGHYGNALQAASVTGHEKVVQVLIDAGADVNTQDEGHYSNALQAASFGGHEKVVQMLIYTGADINAPGGKFDNALYAASSEGHEKVVQMLIDAGADVNAQNGEYYDNALQAASEQGYEKVVQMLMDAGADVNAQDEGRYGNALQAASLGGHEKVVQMLIDAGADFNARGGYHDSTALQEASLGGKAKVVQMLMDAGADVNAQGGHYGNALQAASFGGHEKVVQMLIDAGADLKDQGEYYGSALEAAAGQGHVKVVRMLMDAGADDIWPTSISVELIPSSSSETDLLSLQHHDPARSPGRLRSNVSKRKRRAEDE